MKLYPVFSRRIVTALEKLGYQVINIAPNRKLPGFNVYYFEETVELRNTVQSLIQRKHENNLWHIIIQDNEVIYDTGKKII